MDQWISSAVMPLAVWILLSGLDDLFVDLVFCWQWLRGHVLLLGDFHWPTPIELDRAPRRRLAIFVPLWHEHQVIAKMLEHNLNTVRYDRYDFFLGAYPNDDATLRVIHAVAAKHAHVHVAAVPHDGPTSKADCLNSIYQRMQEYEQQHGVRFDVVITHDAEDLIHPESLRMINYYSRTHDMVQVPVLALPTPAREFTHGLYCDDFAEFQSKDIPVRQFLGGFIPSNGVGTGYSRAILEKLAEAHGRIFEPACLTEDYENGYRVRGLGGRQMFVPIHRIDGSLVATREYFPRTFRSAWKQRTRWTIGISLQSWERLGMRAPLRQLYWFWRDRKGLVGNLIAPLTNLLFVWGITATLCGVCDLGMDGVLRWIFPFTLALSALHLSIRACCVARIYGVRFALGVPLRAVFGNVLNCMATVTAIWRYTAAKLHGRPLVWIKTEHTYPTGTALIGHMRRLGEILVAQGAVDPALLETALGHKPAGERLGEYLTRMGLLEESTLYHALAIQHSLPVGMEGKARPVTRALPAAVARKWNVLPFRVASGELFVAGPELPSEEMTRDVSKFCRLAIRYHLVTASEFEQMKRECLPA
jgi:adsorption protein B